MDTTIENEFFLLHENGTSESRDFRWRKFTFSTQSDKINRFQNNGFCSALVLYFFLTAIWRTTAQILLKFCSELKNVILRHLSKKSTFIFVSELWLLDAAKQSPQRKIKKIYETQVCMAKTSKNATILIKLRIWVYLSPPWGWSW